ncbi:hypothetical protein NDU88_006915 [Pleurodeles waltl]|uniref:Uncharacterized protein n=1 Tax=Pleurodeles waltl TaxID=8319 RepID=A0AAV7QKF5_PLEWA|nr:hypothetical protein NDU88_006915 [Pleurodeles waltl]
MPDRLNHHGTSGLPAIKAAKETVSESNVGETKEEEAFRLELGFFREQTSGRGAEPGRNLDAKQESYSGCSLKRLSLTLLSTGKRTGGDKHADDESVATR